MKDIISVLSTIYGALKHSNKWIENYLNDGVGKLIILQHIIYITCHHQALTLLRVIITVQALKKIVYYFFQSQEMKIHCPEMASSLTCNFTAKIKNKSTTVREHILKNINRAFARARVSKNYQHTWKLITFCFTVALIAFSIILHIETDGFSQ